MSSMSKETNETNIYVEIDYLVFTLMSTMLPVLNL